MSLRIFLFIVCLLPSFPLRAQDIPIELVDFPSMYNHAEKNMVELQQKLATKNSKAETTFYTQWALLKLYNHLGKMEESKTLLEQIVLTAEQTQRKDLLCIALTAQIRMDELLSDHKQLKRHLSKLKEMESMTAFPIAQIEYQCIEAFHFTEKSDSAFSILHSSIQLAKQIDSHEQLLQAYLFAGQILLNKKSRYDESIVYFDTVKQLAKKWNAQKYTALSFMHTGDALAHQGKFDNAIESHRKGLEIFQQLKDMSGIITSFKYIGNSQYDIDKFTEAIKYYQQGVSLSLSSGFNKYLPVFYQNIGVVYAELNSDSNIYYLEKGLNTAKSLHDVHSQALASFNVSQYYVKKKQFDKATYFMSQAIQLFKTIDEYNNVSWVIPQLVTLTLDQHKYHNTKPKPNEIKQLQSMLNEAVSLNADGNNYKNLQSIYKNYTQLALFTNDYKTASYYQAKLIDLNDTVYNQQRMEAAMQTSEKLKTAEQKSRIAMLELKSTRDRAKQQMMWLLFDFSIIGGVLFYINYRKRMKQKNVQMLRKQKEEFRNQLSSDLHDDVGTMLTGLAMQSEMVSLTATGQQKETLEEISSISREVMSQMRDIIWTIDSRKDKFENLFARMKAYTEQQLHVKNISHQFIIEEEETFADISPEVRQNVYLIFKEAIANIIKHSNANFVQIRIFRSNQKNMLIIADNGTTQTLKNTDGIGMTSMEQRAKTIQGKLTIDTHNGYKVTLEF
ncbi:MAG: hypothetical protein JNM95_08845 [Chitinophagaceae bacterium]|nr:hypothetical protein [Chitinophagaceae bacterium]